MLFLRFASSDANCPIERLDIADLDHERAMRFLAHLETGRGNSIATLNARLAALHTFAHFLAAEPTIADAVLDRIVHNAYRIDLTGESQRKRNKPPPLDGGNKK